MRLLGQATESMQTMALRHNLMLSVCVSCVGYSKLQYNNTALSCFFSAAAKFSWRDRHTC